MTETRRSTPPPRPAGPRRQASVYHDAGRIFGCQQSESRHVPVSSMTIDHLLAACVLVPTAGVVAAGAMSLTAPTIMHDGAPLGLTLQYADGQKGALQDGRRCQPGHDRQLAAVRGTGHGHRAAGRALDRHDEPQSRFHARLTHGSARGPREACAINKMMLWREPIGRRRTFPPLHRGGLCVTSRFVFGALLSWRAAQPSHRAIPFRSRRRAPATRSAFASRISPTSPG